jgi:hypothetical protein
MKRITNAEKLLGVLSDKAWHDTAELARKVGHTFAGAKYRLVGYRHHYTIEKRRHPAKKREWQYRLVE